MTPKEKAQELVDKFIEFTQDWDARDGYINDEFRAKECALIAVDEIIRIETHHVHHKWVEYWKEVKHELNKMIYCFRCFKMKPADEFQDNRRHYQIKSRQGKVFSCNPCSRKWTLDNLKAVRFDFENSSWIINDFKNTDEAIKFLEDENNNRIRRQIGSTMCDAGRGLARCDV